MQNLGRGETSFTKIFGGCRPTWQIFWGEEMEDPKNGWEVEMDDPKMGGGIDSDMGGGCKYMTERRGDGEGDGDAGQKPHKTAPPLNVFLAPSLPFPDHSD